VEHPQAMSSTAAVRPRVIIVLFIFISFGVGYISVLYYQTGQQAKRHAGGDSLSAFQMRARFVFYFVQDRSERAVMGLWSGD
jgi:hypothetical protein